ncbi:MAG TPA: PH domain-containing protein [Caulobacteraceae bacterium]|jgi:hypothetical protein
MTEAITYQGEPGDNGLRAATEQLSSLLVAGEALTAVALQHRLFALTHRRNAAAATTGRFIFLSRRLLGGYDPVDVRWQDLKEARLKVGLFGATVTVEFSANLSDTAVGERGAGVIEASGLRIPAAQALYRECQAQVQAWREKRRMRSIEEMRAQAGGVQIATGLYPPSGAAGAVATDHQQIEATSRPVTQPEDPAQRLARAKTMLTQGLITDAEFEAIKAKIIGSL